MEDRHHTEPWPSARPSGAVPSDDIEATIQHPKPHPLNIADEQLRGLSIDGRYEIGDCIGAGGMSRVYVGVHTQTGVRVAIKLIDPALSREPATKQRLLSEARAMMELQSSHIVRAHDVGAIPNGQLYVVMEFLDGENLDVLLTREGPLPWPRVAALGAQICSGLATAHRRKIIHRDIKPQNVIRVAVDGNPEHIKIIDFGVAREIRIEAGPTEQGVLPGTPEYMAPELVLQRGARADERTDLYALGVTLYKLLTGRLPFQGSTYMETLRRHVGEALTLPSAAAPALRIPPEADALLAKLLAKDPAQRFASAEELAAALRTDRRTPGRRTPPPVDVVKAPLPRAPSTTHKRDLIPPSTLIPIAAILPPVARAEITEPPPPSQTLDTRFILLRMSTLLVVSALFAVGTFTIRPRAEVTTPARSRPVLAQAVLPPKPTTPPLAPPKDPPAATPAIAPVVAPPVAAPPVSDPPIPVDAPPVEPPPVVPPPVVAPGEPPPLADDPPVGVDPELPPDPVVPPDTAEPTTPPEPNFGYGDARKLVEEQHVYLRNECMIKRPKKPLARLKFRFDVRPDGRSIPSVFSGEKDVRKCVRDLFKFPFDPSPRGGAFEYTLTSTSGGLKPVPIDPEKVK